MRVSYIITTRDERPEILNATLRALARTTSHVEGEIIVVDDGSQVPVQLPRGNSQLLRNAQPRGVSPARRIGANAAMGDVLVWLDAHMTFADDWLDNMLPHAASGALLCSAFWDYELTLCHCWGANYLWCGERDYFQQRYPGFGLRHRVSPPDSEVVDVPMIIGACYMLSRASHKRLCGFSPLFRIWGIDEQDLCLRACLMGIPVRCVTTARVGHLSRNAFPYPVGFEHLEFNQLVMIRSVFEASTIERLERFFAPLPQTVTEWLEETDVQGWRAEVQAGRVLSDRELLDALGITLPVAGNLVFLQ